VFSNQCKDSSQEWQGEYPALNSDIEISRKDAKARRMKGKKNMLLQKFSKHFTNSVNSPLQKFLKTTLRLCDFA
jgi:hypothetical protein